MPDGPRYEDDFYAWTQHQAEVLRTMPVSDNRFDREHGRRRAARGLQRHGEADVADSLPQLCPYSFDEICQEDWYPDPVECDPKTEAI
jgi:hypothetical protein